MDRIKLILDLWDVTAARSRVSKPAAEARLCDMLDTYTVDPVETDEDRPVAPVMPKLPPKVRAKRREVEA